MSNYTRINISIEEEDLEQWDQYVGEGGRYASRSGLIRQAVRNEIERIEADPGGSAVGDTEAVEDLRTTIQDLSEEVQRMSDRQETTVEMVEQTVESTTGSQSPVDPRSAIRAVVPSPSELPDDRRGYSAAEIANRLNADVEFVRGELASLQVSNPRVGVAEIEPSPVTSGHDGRTVYYEQEVDR